MLQVTDTAASVFRQILELDHVAGNAIRLVPASQADGQGGITVQPIEKPDPADKATKAKGVEVVVAPELAPTLDDAILDARETEAGADLFLRPQEGTES
jgi:Fe-S cluster assembly iron-binding protein IscA